MLIPFSPPPGINSDETTFAAQGRWSDGNNVRFRNGRAEPIGGWVAGDTGPSGTRNLFLITINSTSYVIFGAVLGSAIYAAPGGSSPTSIGSAGFDITGWAFAKWGNTLLAVPRGGPLYTWPGSGSISEITQSPNAITDMLVARRQVIAFGCNEELSGTFNGMCIRWSDFEDNTDWTSTATNNAGEFILDGEGVIVGARAIGEYLAVWTTNDLWLGQFIGDPGQTWRFDKVDEGCGLAGPDAVATINGVAYWVAGDLTICAWSPGQPPARVPCPIHGDFVANIEKTIKQVTFAFANNKFSEIWFFYPDNRDAGGDEIPTRYIAFSLVEPGTPWFRGILQRDAMIPGDGAVVAAYGVNHLGVLNVHEFGNANRTWYIQSADQYIDNSQRRMMIRGVIPDFKDQSGDASLTLFCRDRSQSTAVTKGPYTLTTAATKKDFRASGKLIAAKFSGAAGTYARLGKPIFDAVAMGER